MITDADRGDPDDDLDMLTVHEVGRELGGDEAPLHPATVYRLVQQGVMPPPLKFGGGTSRWPRRDVRQVKLARLAARELVST